MKRTNHRLVGLSSVLATAVLVGLPVGTRALALRGEGCCGACATSSPEIAKKLDAAIQDWGRVPEEMKALPAETRERLTQATSVLRDTNPGFALMPATLQKAVQLLDAAGATGAKTCCGDDCSAVRGDVAKSVAEPAADGALLAAKTSALLGSSMRALAESSFGATAGTCCAAAPEKSCCEGDAKPSTDALVKEADQLLEKWKGVARAVSSLAPEQRTKLDEAVAFASANCPIGKRMVVAFALGHDALAATIPKGDAAENSDRARLVKKAASLIDAARTHLR